MCILFNYLCIFDKLQTKLEKILSYIPKNLNSAFVNGAWKNINLERENLAVENPANKNTICEIFLASKIDCDEAVTAAREAFKKLLIDSP